MSDVVVIGGGLLGMLSARALRLRGATVRLFDRQRCGREASWAGGGILSPLYPWRQADALNALAQRSQMLYPDLAAQLLESTGIDPEWTQSGLLTLDAEEIETAATWCRQWQYPLEIHQARQIIALEPQLTTADSGILRQPTIAQIRSSRLVEALRSDLQGQGVLLHEGEPVERLLIDRHRVTGLMSRTGRYEADRIVLAAGAWTQQLLPLSISTPAIVPVRGQMIILAGKIGLLRHIVLSRNRYLIPRRDGRILVGSTVEESGYDTAITEAARQELQSFAVRLMPGLSELPVEYHWAGLRPGKRDVPVIGAHPEIANLYINTGHYRNGIVTAPASAELLMALMEGETPRFDPEAYAWKADKPDR